jgi:putative hydrolase of the HAD superfamily
MLRLFRSYELPADLAAAERAVWACLNGWDEHLYLPDDTIDTLVALRRRYGVALVSNFDHPPYVRQMLDRLGLTGLFDDIRISGELRIDKPDPRIFQAALDALDCPPPQAVFVGDNLHADIEGARGVGCLPILIDMKARYIEYTEPRIERLGELPPLIAQLES